MGLNKTQVASITVCVLVLVVVAIILFSVAFATVLPTYCAIDFNTVSNSINEKRVYYEGRHFIGLGHKFITYPMSWQIMDFSDDEEEGDLPLDAGSSDGQPIKVEVTVFYSIPPQTIVQLYRLLGTSYKGILLSATKSELKNTASKYNTSEFFTQREQIAVAMEQAVARVMSERHCRMEMVRLREITFPKDIETQLVNKVISAQQIKKNNFLKIVRQVQADTSVILAEANRTINEMLSSATAAGNLVIEEAKAAATTIFVNAQAEAWQQYKHELGLNNSQLIRVQWARQLLRGAPSTKLLVGYDDLSASVVTP